MKEKHLVCQGAICKCQFGTTPDKLVVKTQSKRYINDKEGLSKLTATNVDIGSTFDKNTFGSCAKMNNNPCAPVVTKWEGYYDKITVVDNGGKALLEDSKATCAVSGTPSIEIVFHGQTAEPNLQNVNNVRPEVLAHLMPFVEEKLNGYYYNYNGIYEGNITNQKKGNANDVYACNGKGNEEGDFLNAKKLKITHNDFQKVCNIVKHEGLSSEKEEYLYIAHTNYNEAKRVGQTMFQLLNSGYSSVEAKFKNEMKDTEKDKISLYSREGAIDALLRDVDNNIKDPTDNATQWDGEDFLAWGIDTDLKPDSKTKYGHNKFDEYDYVKISKNLYNSFVSKVTGRRGSNLAYSSIHETSCEKGVHIHKQVKERNKAIYNLPNNDFSKKEYWTTGDFYYKNKSKKPFGLEATRVAGYTIFWKKNKN